MTREGDDVLIVTWANGRYLSERVAERLAADGIGCRILDIRWLAPLPIEEIVRHADSIGRVLVVDETRRTGGAGEAIVSGLAEAGYRGRLRRVAGARLVRPARRRRPPGPRVGGRHRGRRTRALVS